MKLKTLAPRVKCNMSSDDFIVALCRAHSEWDSETDSNSQPLLRTLREAAQGLIKKTSPKMTTLLKEIVTILCHDAPNPLEDIAKNNVMVLADDLVWERAAIDDDFCLFLAQLVDSTAPPEPKPRVVLSAASE